MNRIKSLITLLLIIVLFPLNYSFAQSAEEILENVEQNVRNTNLLSYHADYTSVNPTVNDSVSKTSGTVWLKKIPTDSIFGAYFHVEGVDGHDNFDYFYDGQNSYEIRHKRKEITIFHPHEHPNTRNNPAKARTALLPFQELLINKELKNTILEDHSKASIDEKQLEWIITLVYPEDEHGQEVTKSLEIDKNSFQIHRITQKVRWRGSTYRTLINFSNYQKDVSSITDNIFVSKNYEDYSKEEFSRESPGKSKVHEDLIGNPAPEFTFESFSGDQISLGQYKGKIVLLDFWESWCGYCIMAMPKLKELQSEWKDNFTIIGIVTENKQPVSKLIENNSLTYPNIYADRDILDDYNVSARPTYVLINQEGKVISVTAGNLEEIETKIRQLLN